MSGEVLSTRVASHGLEVVTVAGTQLRRPQVTLIPGVAGTADAEEIFRRLGDLESFTMAEPRRSARQDRRG